MYFILTFLLNYTFLGALVSEILAYDLILFLNIYIVYILMKLFRTIFNLVAQITKSNENLEKNSVTGRMVFSRLALLVTIII